LLPGFRLHDVARRLLAEQPDPPRRVGFGDLIEIHAPTLVYALVVVPVLAVGYITLSARHLLPLDDTARSGGLIFLAMALLMAWLLVGLRNSLSAGVAATGEIVDVTRAAGHVRFEINGHTVEKAYRAPTLEKLAPGDRITVLVDPRKETVLLALARVGSGF